MDSIASAVAAMSGDTSSKEINLTNYREAMVFLGDGTDWVELKFATIAYAKQLLVCIGKDVKEDWFNVDEITKTFLKEETFKDLHNPFASSWNVVELSSLMDLMHEELCKYVNIDKLDYEPEDVNIWFDQMRDKIISCVRSEISEDMANFISSFHNRRYERKCWSNFDITKCNSYAWLGSKLADGYGYHLTKSSYSSTFLKWCEQNMITDKDKEKERLYKLFKVSDDAKLDKILEMNMVE